MTFLILFVCCQLRDRFVGLGEKEDRIITEAIAPLACVADDSLPDSLEGVVFSIGIIEN